MPKKKEPSAAVKASMRYQHNKTRLYGVRVYKNTEADIIQKLESVKNKQGYIKALIRADIVANGMGE